MTYINLEIRPADKKKHPADGRLPDVLTLRKIFIYTGFAGA